MSTNTGVGVSTVKGSGSSYWTPQSLVVENVQPTKVVMTGLVADTSAVASDFTISGFTVSSLSRDATNKNLTLTLNTSVLFGDTVNVVYKSTSYSATNNVVSGALLFNAGTDYLVSDDTALLNNEIKGTTQKFSISMTFKRVVVDGAYQTIFSRDNNSGGRQFACEFIGDTSNKDAFGFYVFDSPTKYTSWWSTISFRDISKWYHVVITFDNTQALASKCVIYVNNKIVTTNRTDVDGGVTNVKDNSAEPIYINVTNYGGLINPFGGYLAKIGFYTNILNATDVGKLYNTGLSCSDKFVNTSIAPFMLWDFTNAVFGANWTLDDSMGTAYAVSKSFTSSGMAAIDRSDVIIASEDTATNTLITAHTTPPSDVLALKIREFILGCKNDSNWDKLDRVGFMATETQQGARLDWKNPAIGLSEVSGIAWTTAGYTGDGIADCLHTGFIPATHGVNFTRNSNSFGIHLTSDKNEGTSAIGVNEGTSLSIINPRSGGAYAGRANTTVNIGGVTANSIGLHSIVRSASNLQQRFTNGVGSTTQGAASTALQTYEFTLLAYNNAGTDALFSTNNAAFWFAGSGTVDQLKLYNRMVSFLNGI